MSDKFSPIKIKQLLQLILNELESNQSIFGIPQELFFKPAKENPLKTEQFGQIIDTPIGVAAGPHSQMAQNIIGAWLMGARYIELKTIQTLDELDVSKPCIDIQDEGYNCEWSQELKIKESFNEYLNAWIIIHILNHKLNLGKTPGTIFNMSVGYNLEGILKENVQWFFSKMENCSAELKEKIQEIKGVYPEIDSIQIATQISDNITLSTMHGCPANEIESIASYLLSEKKLHTYVKLNPTLLGPEKLRKILNKTSKFKTEVPDIAFEHDLKYPDAINIIKSLKKKALENDREFGLKLTNTLESINNKNIFDDSVDMMYMSGRALHPISVNVANKLQLEFNGELQLSFSAGADAFNVSDILSCGFKTITVCSDILKPGGYMRMNQYFDELSSNFELKKAKNITEFIQSTSTKKSTNPSLENLSNYAEKVLVFKRYKREHIQEPSIKTDRNLGYFDCISAPCRDTCATNQDIPDYLYYTSKNQFDKAYEVILRTNPFPSITGMVCDHLCQNKCSRINYDKSLLIREVKRFISEQTEVKLAPKAKNGVKVAIIGAGPSGLSCAYYLALAGFSVEVFESKSKAGGMVQYAIPGFRLTDNAIERDFKRVIDLGVNIHYNQKVDKEQFELLKSEYKYVFIGAGAQLSALFQLEGIESKGVLDSLDFLFNTKAGKNTGIGNNVVIIGGGNTAMDAARTAFRLVGNDGKVTIVYRRTINEMPADQGEIKAVMEEGMEIIELTAPEKVISENGSVKALLCSRMELGEKDASGRRKPVKINGSEFEISCDTIIHAIGQNLDIDFAQTDLLKADLVNYKTQLDNVFIGGDALRGAATAIKAIGDGRKAAEQIMKKASIDFSISKPANGKNHTKKELILKRAFRMYPPELNELDSKDRRNFKLISETLDKNSIVKEADRCLHCDEICNICTTVCPNFANYSYEIEPVKIQLQKTISDIKGQITFENDGFFEINQKYQILNIANFCNECGNCNTFCPTNSAPYKEKPKFWLTKESFDTADEGYYVSKKENHKSLYFKSNGQIASVSENTDDLVYNSVNATALLSKKDMQIQKIEFLNGSREFCHRQAVEMIILLKAAENLVFEIN
ncbi:MAG: putative selenate reductase subunit YgfK [Bacteroidetes bacterium GWF2_33_16]|nr:MAG: putative selenate reductase subunit YgfK [Bacteroidetes bacterium GWE2_32_14]OFY02246.1 MAG: putative selenate reductase subunit YgfK [Bacteroidetes bacterium GWF2_33_16]